MSLRLFHTADLHLTAKPPERDYGLAVLDELVYHCRRLQADAWLLSGDIFDTPDDLAALAGEVSGRLAELEGLPVVMIPGNHELAGIDDPADLAAFAIGNLSPAVTLVLERPYGLLRPEGLDAEFMAVPFQSVYGGFMDWPHPPLERRWRVGLLHGTVNGMTFTGLSGETEHGVIDPHLFEHLGLHYAALGHIHGRGEARFGGAEGCLAHYPGSARVWRRGEDGPRRSTLAVLDGDPGAGGGAATEAVEIIEAGQWRHLPVPLDAEGGLLEHDGAPALIDILAGQYGPRDWLHLELQGFVESKIPAEALQRALERAAEGRFRAFEIGLGELVESERMRDHPLVRAFEAQWRRRLTRAREEEDPAETVLLQRARRLVLEAIGERLAEY